MSAGVADLPAASCAGSDGITQKIREVMIVATKNRKIAQRARRIRNVAMCLSGEDAAAPEKSGGISGLHRHTQLAEYADAASETDTAGVSYGAAGAGARRVMILNVAASPYPTSTANATVPMPACPPRTIP